MADSEEGQKGSRSSAVTAGAESTRPYVSEIAEIEDAKDSANTEFPMQSSTVPGSDPKDEDPNGSMKVELSSRRDSEHPMKRTSHNKQQKEHELYKRVVRTMLNCLLKMNSSDSEMDSSDSEKDSSISETDNSDSRSDTRSDYLIRHDLDRDVGQTPNVGDLKRNENKDRLVGREQAKKQAVMQYASPSHQAELYELSKYTNPLLRETIPGKMDTEIIGDEPAQTTAFDIVTRYAMPDLFWEDPKKLKSLWSRKVLGVLGFYITIHSEALLDAISSLVRFYPRLPAFSKPLKIMEPFCVLRHHHAELKIYRDNVVKELEGDKHQHLSYLLDFLQQYDGDDMEQELTRWKRGMCTFKWIWLLYKPGTTVYYWSETCGTVLRASIVESHDRDRDIRDPEAFAPPKVSSRDNLENLRRPNPIGISTWFVGFDGSVLGRLRKEFAIKPFVGERAITSLACFPKAYLLEDRSVDPNMSTEQALIARGKRFFDFTKWSYMEYDGLTSTRGRQKIHSRVVIDSKYYNDQQAALQGQEPERFIHAELQNQVEMENENTYDTYALVHDEYYRKWDEINPRNVDRISDEQYMVCSHLVYAFVLNSRDWEQLDCSCMFPIKHHPDLIKQLVLNPEAKLMIEALSKRHVREKSGGKPFSADFIQNKGEGQIFLLHGKPGVGKTTTAECVAELTKRPLISLTCGDLGILPEDVETNLEKWLHMATIWDAILLLDEADVYLESRIKQDLQRNSLVSIFLRALEYYEGLLFLTTNRVGTFDDGFISRIHVTIHFPDFTDEKRAQIWDGFFKKLDKEDEKFRLMQRTIDYAKSSKEVTQLGWNGRQIRNAFNTAVALAEYEYDENRDENGKIPVEAKHLQQVVKMSSAFRDYLQNVHDMDIETKAKLYQLRDERERRS